MQHVTIKGLRHMRMPIVGLGTWRAQSEDVQKAVLKALDVGYRHIDTAFNYNNEEAIGLAVKQWLADGKGSRSDLFITTKLPHVGNRANDVEKFLEMSLKRLRLDYIDLYLIHMPFSLCCDKQSFDPLKNEDGTFMLDMTNDNIKTWQAMEEQVRKGLVKSIGLSNFNYSQIRKIYVNSKIKPAVLQVEMHAYCQQTELLRQCDELNIAVTAYAPLGSPGAQAHFNDKYNYTIQNYPDLLRHPTVCKIAGKHKKTSGQVLLKHLIQKGVVVIPKSANPNRIEENINVFDFKLDREDMHHLASLDQGENGRIFNFKFFRGIEKHPEYPFKTENTKNVSAGDN